MSMEKPGYEITIDPSNAFMIQRLWGLWELDLFDEYRQEFAKTVEQTKRFYGTVNLLSDLSEFPVQKGTVADAFERLVAQHNGPVNKTAVVVSGALAHMQANRVAKSNTRCFFRERAKAVTWLSEAS
jgi:hypothetical protein